MFCYSSNKDDSAAAAATAPVQLQLPPQIFVVGQTNMSVDNVLTGLLESGFEDFARVGALKKIGTV